MTPSTGRDYGGVVAVFHPDGGSWSECAVVADGKFGREVLLKSDLLSATRRNEGSLGESFGIGGIFEGGFAHPVKFYSCKTLYQI